MFFSFILQMFSLMYTLVIKLRIAAYKFGFFKSEALAAYVISVGNITTGGTGKTPFVAMIAQWAIKNGIKTAILSRGYKRRKGNRFLIVSDGQRVFASSDEAGDEAFLLAKKLNSVPVLVSKKRHRIGYLALKLFNSHLLLLDDGYQHLSVKRDLNILLIDSLWQFGNHSLLPAGPLREPANEIKRADIIVLTKCTDKNTGHDLLAYFQGTYPEIPILRAGHFPDQVWLPLKNKLYAPKFLSGKRVVAFAGLANTGDFFNMIKDLGAIIIHSKSFPDHKYFNEKEIKELTYLKTLSDADFLLTTEKDWSRIDGKIDNDVDLAILTIKIKIIPEQTSKKNKLFGIIKQGIVKSNELYGY
jgi:tetraacyldisaccharide 4'-kinase